MATRKPISQREAARLRKENRALQRTVRALEYKLRAFRETAGDSCPGVHLSDWNVGRELVDAVKHSRRLGFVCLVQPSGRTDYPLSLRAILTREVDA